MTFPILEITVHPLALIAIGLVAGILAGMMGIGGGILVTPFLNLMGASMTLAVPTSINYIAGTSIMATIRNRKFGNMNLKAGLITAVFMIPAVEASSWLMKLMDARKSATDDMIIRLLFIAFLIWSTIAIGKRDESKKSETWLTKIRMPPMIKLEGGGEFSLVALAVGGIFAGLMAGLLGLGGGRVLLPLFMVLIALDTRIAVGTSSFVIMITSIYGAVSYGAKGLVDYRAVCFLLVGSLVGAVIGTQALNAFKRSTTRKMYVILTVGALIALFLKELNAHSIAPWGVSLETIGIGVLSLTCGGIALAGAVAAARHVFGKLPVEEEAVS